MRAALSLAFHPLSLSSDVLERFCFYHAFVVNAEEEGRRSFCLPLDLTANRALSRLFVRLSNNALTPQCYFFPLRHFSARRGRTSMMMRKRSCLVVVFSSQSFFFERIDDRLSRFSGTLRRRREKRRRGQNERRRVLAR